MILVTIYRIKIRICDETPLSVMSSCVGYNNVFNHKLQTKAYTVLSIEIECVLRINFIIVQTDSIKFVYRYFPFLCGN